MKIGSREQLVILLSLILSIVVLIFDMFSNVSIASGVPYVALVLIGLIAQKPRFILVLAVLGSVLTVVGHFLSPASVISEGIWINRGLALFAIWATAIVSYFHLKMLAQLEPLATTDQLTGLYNRHYFTSELVKQINIWRRYQRPLSILILDIDYFKKVNDSYGHVAGDYVLQTLAGICLDVVRDIDTVARIGGEEFAILLPSTGVNGAMQTAERIRRETEAFSFQYEEARFRLTVSLGVAELTDESWSITEFMKAADEMLYKAKNSGRNRCVARNIG
ncbi:MAG: GGDEF domain-containing protein [Gammaproteobacteria bacterium]|nr:GGDEF domain-containing protein [Gammaproteobacteria bacterium]